MCLNSGGEEMTTDKIFFQKFFRREENDRGYYGNLIKVLYLDLNIEYKFNSILDFNFSLFNNSKQIILKIVCYMIIWFWLILV